MSKLQKHFSDLTATKIGLQKYHKIKKQDTKKCYNKKLTAHMIKHQKHFSVVTATKNNRVEPKKPQEKSQFDL